MFTCTGMCSSCGRCHSGSQEETNRAKERLITFPKDFIPAKEEQGYGIAFDIGTTTVVGLLWNLKRGELTGTASLTNPQTRYGADVISRIAFAAAENHLQLLQREILQCLNDLTERLCTDGCIKRESVIRIVVCGNTTMSHLLLGINPESLAHAPFQPAYRGAVFLQAKDLGIKINEKGTVMVMPNIAGHVGGDAAAGILAVRLGDSEGSSLLIDIGTNGELALKSGERIWLCSTAAGPAFEGASISQGMRAVKGAVERVRTENGEFKFSVIGHVPPVGICGSGLIDAVSEMSKTGIMDSSGRLLTAEEFTMKQGDSPLADCLEKDESGRRMVLVKKREKDICITQKDIREVQLAKAAIAAGISILMKKAGLQPGELNRIYLAGAFGNFIDKKSAMTIGLLPTIDPQKIVPVGNAAGAGALMVLAQPKERVSLQQILKKSIHVNLSDESAFQKEYINAMHF